MSIKATTQKVASSNLASEADKQGEDTTKTLHKIESVSKKQLKGMSTLNKQFAAYFRGMKSDDLQRAESEEEFLWLLRKLLEQKKKADDDKKDDKKGFFSDSKRVLEPLQAALTALGLQKIPMVLHEAIGAIAGIPAAAGSFVVSLSREARSMRDSLLKTFGRATQSQLEEFAGLREEALKTAKTRLASALDEARAADKVRIAKTAEIAELEKAAAQARAAYQSTDGLERAAAQERYVKI